VQQGYTYNEIGNIASFAGVTYSYPAPGQGRPHAVTGTSAGGSFSYDDAGYMESRRDRAGAVTWIYTWWENHKLKQISNSATDDVATFLYGPDDERVKKSSGPAGDTYDSYYLFPFYQVEQGCLRADIDCDGDVDVLDIQAVAGRWNTIYAPFEQNGVAPITVSDITLAAGKWLWEGASSTGQVVKTYSLSGRPVAVNRGGAWTYVFQDHLGSPTLETDYEGRAGARWKYEPYGTMRGTEWTLPIDRAFTGQVIEPGLGLHDYVARHYAQPLGRWIAPDTIVPDPMDPQSLNRYSYVSNRPTVYVDPSGRVQVCGGGCPQDWDELTHQWYAIQDQGLLDATILAWIQDHQNLATIEGMMAYLEATYGQLGAILPLSFNTMYAHGFAAGEFSQLAPNSQAQLLAGAIFAGVGIGGANLGGLRREIVAYDPKFAYLQGGDPKIVVPDSYVIVRGGQSQLPPPGTVFSGSQGATLSKAASGVPHGSIRVTTAGEIRARGGVVEFAPEPSRSGMVNWLHVNVVEGSASSSFGSVVPNPVPKNMRIN
ncbi:MAG: RHS repeat-associated core domain-containing protein, partial [Anaerolineae bacterium]